MVVRRGTVGWAVRRRILAGSTVACQTVEPWTGHVEGADSRPGARPASALNPSGGDPREHHRPMGLDATYRGAAVGLGGGQGVHDFGLIVNEHGQGRNDAVAIRSRFPSVSKPVVGVSGELTFVVEPAADHSAFPLKYEPELRCPPWRRNSRYIAFGDQEDRSEQGGVGTARAGRGLLATAPPPAVPSSRPEAAPPGAPSPRSMEWPVFRTRDLTRLSGARRRSPFQGRGDVRSNRRAGLAPEAHP